MTMTESSLINDCGAPFLVKSLSIIFNSEDFNTLQQNTQIQLVYRIDANTTALDNFFNQKSTFWDKYLITTVIFGSNLNATAPKTSGRKFERRRSIFALIRYSITDRPNKSKILTQSGNLPL